METLLRALSCPPELCKQGMYLSLSLNLINHLLITFDKPHHSYYKSSSNNFFDKDSSGLIS